MAALSERDGYSVGQRVRLLTTTDRFTHLRPGAQGVITDLVEDPVIYHAHDDGTVGEDCCRFKMWVRWDDGTRLAMIPGSGDRIEVLTTEEAP